MEKKTYNNQRNYINKDGYEDYTGVLSMTVPDQSYTVSEIFEKFRLGIHLPISRDVYYSDTDDFDHPDGVEMIDITDFHEMKIKVSEEAQRLKVADSKKAGVHNGEEPAERSGEKPDFAEANKP